MLDDPFGSEDSALRPGHVEERAGPSGVARYEALLWIMLYPRHEMTLGTGVDRLRGTHPTAVVISDPSSSCLSDEMTTSPRPAGLVLSIQSAGARLSEVRIRRPRA